MKPNLKLELKYMSIKKFRKFLKTNTKIETKLTFILFDSFLNLKFNQCIRSAGFKCAPVRQCQ